MTKRIRVGDKVHYRAPRIIDRKKNFKKPKTFTVLELYYGNTMAKVQHENGYVYSGYIVANMTKCGVDLE